MSLKYAQFEFIGQMQDYYDSLFNNGYNGEPTERELLSAKETNN